MIKATELRIGNKFNGAGMIQTVKEILDYGPTGSIQASNKTKTESSEGYEHLILVFESRNQYKPIEIEGIQINSTMLEKLGFEKHPGDITKWRGPNDIYLIRSEEKRAYFLSGFCTSQLVYISFVHQLQNLYYALTGKELIQCLTWTPA